MYHSLSFFSLSCFAVVLLSFVTFALSSPTKFPHFSSTTDQNALLAFKNSITLNPNVVLSINNWSTNTSLCYWAGVSCSPKHNRVTALNVSGFGLRGTIAPHLGNLTFLRSLDFSVNNFTGVVPSELSNLRRLKEINLGFNKLTGEIPSWLGALSQLQYIHLQNNTFSGSIPSVIFNISSLLEINMTYNMLSSRLPDDICNNTAPKLKRIYLTGNLLSGEIPANIYKCRELEELLLGVNQFTGSIPSEIGSLSKLRALSLRSNNLSGNIPSSIFNISSLRTMMFSNNILSGSIPSDIIYNLPEIEKVDFLLNHLIGGIPNQFVNLTSLTMLRFAGNSLTGALPEGLDNLVFLEDFDASFNNLSGTIPPSIFNISTLRGLSLQQNFLSGTLPSTMGLFLPNLQDLYLFFNRLSGEIPSTIANASNLFIIELNRNSFSGYVPNLGNLRLLKALRLWENNLTGLGFLTSLTNCQDLEYLEIADNPLRDILPAAIGNLSTSLLKFFAWRSNISGGIPSEIGNLTGLQVLDLSVNQLTGFIPTTMSKLNRLVQVYLGGNRLQGYIPNGLCEMSNLGELNLSYNLLAGPIHECLGELTSLRTVSFSSNRLNSTIPSKFWDLSDLVTLELSSNYLTGELSPKIGTWKINKLDLSFNEFTGDIPSAIEGSLSLEYLSLSNNRFRGSIPISLGKVRGLTTLNLSNNDLSGSIPKSLEDLDDLENFDVSYNKLEGEIPNAGCFANFTAPSFVHNLALCGATKFQVPPCKNDHGRSKRVALILKYIVPSFVAAIIVVAAIVMLIRRQKMIATPPLADGSMKMSFWRRVSYIELVRGTNSFSELNLLGRGSFGSVFKATLSDGIDIAVKVFNLQLEGAIKSFDTESKILSSIRHRNLVPIIGCCSNTEFKALILEYMQNGSLEKWLHSDSHCLDLVQRLNIATDVALALEYLHHGHTFPVVHSDVKPSNILLDEDMVAHVGDFGISKLFDKGEAMVLTKTLATIGYAAPEYGSEGKVSTKGDVYSYGILLLEMLTRRKPTDNMFSEEMSLKEWVSEAIKENGISEVVAPGLLPLEDQDFSKKEQCASSIFDLAMKCVAFSPDERISMIQVVAALHKIKAKVAAAQVNNMRRRQ